MIIKTISCLIRCCILQFYYPVEKMMLCDSIKQVCVVEVVFGYFNRGKKIRRRNRTSILDYITKKFKSTSVLQNGI